MNQLGRAICKFGSSRVGQISHCRLPGSTGSSLFLLLCLILLALICEIKKSLIPVAFLIKMVQFSPSGTNLVLSACEQNLSYGQNINRLRAPNGEQIKTQIKSEKGLENVFRTLKNSLGLSKAKQ